MERFICFRHSIFFGKCTKNSTNDVKGEYLNLFMMRHCVACHNVVSNSKKLLQKGFKEKKFWKHINVFKTCAGFK